MHKSRFNVSHYKRQNKSGKWTRLQAGKEEAAPFPEIKMYFLIKYTSFKQSRVKLALLWVPPHPKQSSMTETSALRCCAENASRVYGTLGVFVFLGIRGEVIEIIWEGGGGERKHRWCPWNVNFLVEAREGDESHRWGSCDTEPPARSPAGADVWGTSSLLLDSAAQAETQSQIIATRWSPSRPANNAINYILNQCWNLLEQGRFCFLSRRFFHISLLNFNIQSSCLVCKLNWV